MSRCPSTSAGSSTGSSPRSSRFPRYRFAFLVTGPHDFVVHLVARDMQHLKDLVLDNFTNRPAVTRVETSIIYEARVRHELPQLQPPLASSP